MFNSSYRVDLAIRCVFFFGIFAVARADAQSLPPESLVPGQRKEAPLPAEAELPPGMTAHASILPPAQADGQTNQQPPAASLPNEAAVPKGMAAAQAADGTDPDGQLGNDLNEGEPVADPTKSPLELERSLDNTPWLRLQMPGMIGQIRALVFTPDGQRLIAAGDDKCLIIWRKGEDGAWFYERTVRWQVQRGPRGRIYALAPVGNFVALGGLGAMGENGEILLVDPATGRQVAPLNDLERGHHERITSIAASVDPAAPAISSLDMAGRLMHWTQDPNTGIWSAVRVADDPTNAESLRRWRTIHPVAMLGSHDVVAPDFAGADPEGRVRWQLRRWDLRQNTSQVLSLPNDHHFFMVTALATSPQTKRIASADDAGRLFLWLNPGRDAPITHKAAAVVTSMQFRSNGETLLYGTHATQGHPGEIALAQVGAEKELKTIWRQPVTQPVFTCVSNEVGDEIAYCQGGSVVVAARSDGAIRQTLRAPLSPPLRVAFRRDAPIYDIAFGTVLDDQQKVALQQVFDTRRLQLGTPNQIDESQWHRASEFRGEWNLGMEEKIDKLDVYLTRGGQRQATVPLRVDVHGVPSAVCWIPAADNSGPSAVVIGTNGTNNLYVFDLAENGDCPLRRQFRGHEGAVTSIGVSTDRRYLVSGALDGTIRVWMLADLDRDQPSVQRWGAEFQSLDGELVASDLRPDGPLYFRGIRQGDVMSSLRLPDFVEGDVKVTAQHDPDEMVASLSQRAWDQLVGFDYRRGRQPERSFQMYPAWQPVVSLFVAENREWAYWTPSGYYDASFEGDKLFGWQVNRGLQQLPDFFLAAQVRDTLERPDTLGRLLEEGNLEAAFRVAGEAAPANWSRVLIKQQQLKPSIQILSPLSDRVQQGELMSIQAAVEVPAGERLVLPKAFVNGVTAGQPELVQEYSSERGPIFEYRWEARVPSDPRLLVQVFASTEQNVVGRAEVFVMNQAAQQPRSRQLFLLTAGVNNYRDGRLTRLNYAVDNALNVASTFERNTQELYQSRSVSLVDRRVTRPMWNLTVESVAAEIEATVSPDDLLVVYLSGHGLRDATDGGYYYVTADADVSDLLSGQFADCLSFSDFARSFANLRCRKLVILDTCHSGAVLPLSQRELKAALRALQDDLVFTLSATEGGQEAVEDREKRLGRFTFHLLEGLRGAADQGAGDRDGEVTLDELIEYVQRTVSEEAARDPQSVPQHPTAGPIELLGHTPIPLTKVAK